MYTSAILAHLQHAQTDNLEAAALEAADNLADQPALYAVRLDHNKGAFHFVYPPRQFEQILNRFHK